jgi:uncharacterized membrane protein YagU involved in acid resistance
MSTLTATPRWPAKATAAKRYAPAKTELAAGAKNLPSEVMDGAAGGLIATVPMTLVMLVIRRFLPWPERYRLEPRIVTEKTIRRLGLGQRLRKPQRQALAGVAHLAFGAVAGAVFGPLAARLPLHPAIGGLLYGLAVWAGSYAGWIPALGIMRPPDARPEGRNWMMVIAHVVWGTVLGQFVRRQNQDN